MLNDPASSPVQLNESHWGKIDDSAKPQDFASYLEFIEGSKVIKFLRENLFDLLPFTRNSRVLDAGCGLGAHTRALAKKIGPAGSVTGIDRSGLMIEKAKSFPVEVGSAEIRFDTGDICALPYENECFDAIFTDRVFIHVSEPERALAEFRRVLKPGGYVAMSETDWSVTDITPSSEQLTLLVAEKLSSFANASFGAEMDKYFRQAGFEVLQHNGHFHSHKEYDLTWKVMNMEGAGHRLIEKGLLTKEQYVALKEGLQQAEVSGEFEVKGTMYFGLAQKKEVL